MFMEIAYEGVNACAMVVLIDLPINILLFSSREPEYQSATPIKGTNS